MNILKFKTNVFKTTLLRLGIVLFLMSITRIVFYLFNSENFSNVGIWDFTLGVYFDLVTICLVFLPFIVGSFIPGSQIFIKWKEIVLKVYFHAMNSIVIALNLMDVEYFKYTYKRSTKDLFTILGAGEDFKQLLSTFVYQFWYLIILFIAFVTLSIWLYNKIDKLEKVQSTNWKKQSLNFLFVPLTIVLARGGFQLKPVSPIDAAKFGNPENTALVLNTTFTMIKSFGKNSLEMKSYFSEERAYQLFNPIKHSNPSNLLEDKPNVMIIILESFGNEFCNKKNNEITYTPFFDSIVNQSLSFEYGIANGKKSIEAVPAIIASLPSLMDNPYISSSYSDNKINSLAHILKNNGYYSAFFHGATNGSMRFDAFSAQMGFDDYFGRSEYDNDDHFDGTWGISDEYFNPWTALKISTFKTPFFATLFTISSHHPYYIPETFENQVKEGPHPICASLNYADYSLRKFFEAAKLQPWYENTLFVLVADHTPATNDPVYAKKKQIYRIPIAFYHPKNSLPKKREKMIFQQIDIMPTILDFLNINTKFYAFGQSYFDNKERFAVNYLEGVYYYFFNEFLVTFVDDQKPTMINFNSDESGSYAVPLTIENHIKAIIQRYNNDLIRNRTSVK
jgi:phosphoglycerol transferase MdoB-like AlkP superfamily enzyme